MSNSAGDVKPLIRRAWASVSKYKQFLDLLEQIEGSSFPHKDGRLAIAYIRSSVELERDELLKKLDRIDEKNPALEKRILRNTRDLARIYTKALGMVLRSTNLRNNFEIYHSLKKLCRAAVGEEAHLILSSEWVFNPMTMPMSIETLPGFIFIGTPAAESKNLLVLPLSGHEIGHSIWEKMDEDKHLTRMLTQHTSSAIRSSPESFNLTTEDVMRSEKEPEPKDDNEDKDPVRLFEKRISKVVIAKGQEVFCDLVGLHIFGLSYIHAFEYFLAPGDFNTSETYPPDAFRVAAMKRALDRQKIPYPEEIFGDWVPPTRIDRQPYIDYSSADQILDGGLDLLIDCCEIYLEERKIHRPNQSAISEIRDSFDLGEPHSPIDRTRPSVKLSEIVGAFWDKALEEKIWMKRDELPEGEQHPLDRVNTLHEIALKTIEVTEYYSRTKDAGIDA